ncbi:MAG: murein DD-endopeptidase MepM/ murein hydrolase activator NlpD [Arenicella sp.]|jgi:murein DD-endopeptidase MepM/ murein hydrolase activator NlpD
MKEERKWKQFWQRNRKKHKLSFTDDATYDEKWGFNLSSVNLWTLLATYTILILFIFFIVLKFTPIGNMFSNGIPSVSVTQVNDNSNAIDSLTDHTRSTQLYLDDLKKILLDEPFDDSSRLNPDDSTFLNYEGNFDKSREDSLLRLKVENEEKPVQEINYDFFFAPVKGVISQSFNPKKSHYGIDVVTSEAEPIKSCLEGTVIFSSWTSNDGDIIMIQHNNEYISVYKHCSSLLKSVGEKVQTGDPIAIVGNSGKHTTGPHLHFELWKRGTALNPQEFIRFSK